MKLRKSKRRLSVMQIKTHIREFIMDSQMEDGDIIAEMAGCPPISDELLEREEEESDKRLARIDFLMPILFSYSTLYASALVDRLMPELSEKVSPETHKALAAVAIQTKQMMEESMTNLLAGTISQLVDLNVLTIKSRRK